MAIEDSNWVPGRAFREFQIADIEAETRTNPGADWNHENIVVDECRHAKTADEVGGVVNAAVAAEDRIRRGQIINKHHGAVAVDAGIEAQRRAFPVKRSSVT